MVKLVTLALTAAETATPTMPTSPVVSTPF